MRLIIDQGNSRVKIAIYEGGVFVTSIRLPCLTIERAKELLDQYRVVDRVMYCCSGEQDDELVSFLKEHVADVVLMDSKTRTPLRNLYHTPSTLGLDRMATAVGVWTRYRHKELVVLDFGSAITVDFVSAKAEFLGGSISPGLGMRLAALNMLTDRLPLLDVEQVKQRYEKVPIARDTVTAIEQGVVGGICAEVEAVLNKNRTKTAVFTGGDAVFFEKQIKNTIFVDQEATLRGLFTILEYNA